ncbi:hypothetical protein FQR65_LT13511 [Abscondita terminalis]|nr:hypothetical protein FQR65_LT13511 [Abscondita terminalis]
MSVVNILLIIFGSCLILYYWYLKISRKRLVQLIEKLPGPNGWPLIGNALEFAGTPSQIFKKLYSFCCQYDRVIRVWICSRPYVILTDPRDAEIILNSNIHIEKADEYKLFKPWLGNGLLISKGHNWKTHRKLIAPTFHLNILKSFIPLFNANSRATVEKLRKENENTFDCHDYMSEATVEMLLETVMGISKKSHSENAYEYAMAVMKMCEIIHLRQFKFWLKPNWIFNLTKYKKLQKDLLNVIHTLTRKVVKNKMEEFQKGVRTSIPCIHNETSNNEEAETDKKPVIGDVSFGQPVGIKDDLDVDDNDVGEKKRLAFLDLMIEVSQNGLLLNNEEIKEEVDTIIFEGHDTTAAASSFFLCLMAAHPKIQESVHQEIDAIFGNSDREATFADTLKMKYLERCLLETLRLYPPVPMIARKLNQDVKLASKDYVLPAGCTVLIATFKIHRRGDIYANPDTFDPENFDSDRTVNRHYYSFIPFSAGPRSCVGRKYAMLKLKILLSTIMRNFVVKSHKKESDFELQGDIILKRADGFSIKLEPRHLLFI